ncbi:uncharacterized protein LOC143914991 [Arctopsyche grandis]|uniref:uncharacterized protein LOC143914991 n=1 Tax=Arctopsyche grandis TaxID=121162 RepID=UPI00406D8149
MCDTSSLPENCKVAIEEFIQKNGLKDVALRISPGSEKGDNYVGEMNKIEITSKHNKSVLFNLIAKTTSNKAISETLKVENLYNREADLYNIILPAFKKFQDEHNIPIEERFESVKCYIANTNVILMEDVSAKGYKMNNRYNSFDSDHLELALFSLARYHSISFAMKKLNPEMYKNLAKLVEESVIFDLMNPLIKQSLLQATAIIDDASKAKKLLSFSENGVEKFYKYIASESAAPYDVICHADCWNNNILFQYKNGTPVDMKFVDWQIARSCSPITDLSQMIYCCTDEPTRAKYSTRLFNMYHEVIKKQLSYFDCDVEECYPRAVFENHLKEFLPYGLLMSTITIPITLSNKGTEVDVVDMFETDDSIANKCPYTELGKDRMKGVVDDFINMKMI